MRFNIKTKQEIQEEETTFDFIEFCKKVKKKFPRYKGNIELRGDVLIIPLNLTNEEKQIIKEMI